MTPYQRLVDRWKDCQECALCSQRLGVVFARGVIPAKVLFVGEAPGQSEDVIGQPFVGPAGIELDRWIEQAMGKDASAAFFNLVGCFPREAKATDDHQPAPGEIKACLPRLKEFISICKPRLIVAVGQLADKYVTNQAKMLGVAEIARTTITHPAAVLRMSVAQRGMAAQRAVVVLRSELENLVE